MTASHTRRGYKRRLKSKSRRRQKKERAKNMSRTENQSFKCLWHMMSKQTARSGNRGYCTNLLLLRGCVKVWIENFPCCLSGATQQKPSLVASHMCVELTQLVSDFFQKCCI